MFWSRGFCLLTTGGSTMNRVRKYIENQGIKGGENNASQ